MAVPYAVHAKAVVAIAAGYTVVVGSEAESAGVVEANIVAGAGAADAGAASVAAAAVDGDPAAVEEFAALFAV